MRAVVAIVSRRVAALGLIALAGCASQRAVEDAEALIRQGQAREGLALLQRAAGEAPDSVPLRVALLRNRDQVLQSLFEQVQRARAEGRAADANAGLAQILEIQPGHARADAIRREMAQEQQWEAALKEAHALLDKKEIDRAREKVRAVTAENPRHPAARELMRRIDLAAEAAKPEPALGEAFRKPVSIEFRDATLRTVFDVLSRTSGLNFVFDKDVRTDQKTSVVLRNSTVEAVVNMVLLTNQLEQRVVDASTVLIYPASATKLRDYQPLAVRSFYLAHAEAKAVAATVRAIAKSRDVVVDDKLNLLIVRDSPAAIRIVERLVALHDVPEPEVMLDVEILEIKRTRLLELGVRWPDQLALAPLASASGASLTVQELRNLNSSRIGATIGTTTINAKNQDSDANILANPRIRTKNREKAKILIGERVPNITTTLTSTGFASDSVTYVDVGLKLDVEPTVFPDGEVAIRVALEVSNLINQIQTKSGSVAYQIGTRGAQTVLRLGDGENQVLAGLISDEDRRTAYKVPGAGALPIVGRLFGSQLDDSSKTEIVLSITPRIVRNIPRPAAGLAEFAAGTEASVGQRAAAGAPAAGIGTPPPVPPTPGVMQRPPGVPGPATQAPADAAPAAAAAAAAGNTLALSWLAPRQARVGDVITVQLIARSDQAIADLPVAINYDPAVLQLQAANEGDFMRQGGGTAQYVARVEPAGQVAVGATRSGGAATGGAGVLTALTFRAIAASPATAITANAGAAVAAAGGGLNVQNPAPARLIIAPAP
jgi:general secretion pathway protein D